jgi:hypothetical protein
MRCISPAPALPFLLAVACAGNKDSGTTVTGDWLMSDQELGSSATGSPDADLSDPTPLWFVSQHFLPGIQWDDPTVDIPLFVFETIAMDNGVADSGSCPYEQIDGATTTWRSDCRSTQGYNWTGRMVRERWEEDSVTYTRWDSDLEIEGDVADPEFDNLSLHGSWVYASGDRVELVTGIQANLRVSLQGYWSRADTDDPREESWSDWAWTGREELAASGTRRLEGTGRLSGFGTGRFDADSLVVSDACDRSPTGEVAITGQQSVTLTFHGETDCRQCADLAGEAAVETEICAR